jgi:hypothetical protein
VDRQELTVTEEPEPQLSPPRDRVRAPLEDTEVVAGEADPAPARAHPAWIRPLADYERA